LSKTGNKTRFTYPNKLYWVATGGVILYFVLDAIAQSLPPHYSPVRTAESDLAVGPYGYIMAVNFLNRGILSLVFIYALLKSIELGGGSTKSFRSGFTLLGIWAVGAILLAFFPTDVPATPMSWHGAIHFVVAIIAFIGGAFGALALSRGFGRNAATMKVKQIADPIAYLVLVFWLVEFLTPFISPHLVTRFGGLFERLFLGSVLFWIFAVSLYEVTQKAIPKTLEASSP